MAPRWEWFTVSWKKLKSLFLNSKVLFRSYPKPVLNPQLLKLAQWIRAYYACTWESILERMIPPALRKGTQSKEQAFIQISEQGKAFDLEKIPANAIKQKKALEFLKQQSVPVAKSKIVDKLKIPAATLSTLVKKGLIEQTKEAVHREAYDDELSEAKQVQSKIQLNEEQQAAVDSINQSIDSAQFNTHLVHGSPAREKPKSTSAPSKTPSLKTAGFSFSFPKFPHPPNR